MAHGDDWSAEECDLIVADYFAMLRGEQAGRQYNMSAHRKALIQRVDRANGSIEFKHCNITAILEELGVKGIDDYKPRPNYQNSLLDAIERYLQRSREAALIAVPDAVGPELRLVEAPSPIEAACAETGGTAANGAQVRSGRRAATKRDAP